MYLKKTAIISVLRKKTKCDAQDILWRSRDFVARKQEIMPNLKFNEKKFILLQKVNKKNKNSPKNKNFHTKLNMYIFFDVFNKNGKKEVILEETYTHM